MASTKKPKKSPEVSKEAPVEPPLIIFTEDDPKPVLRIATPDEYIAAEYPGLMSTQNIPQLLKALLRETVIGRMQK